MNAPRDGRPEDRARESVELVRRAQRGDGAAFAELLERYYPRVQALVRARMGSELRHFVESADVVQETMGQVLRSFERFDMRDEDALVKWLSQLVENRLRDLAKHHGREKRGSGRERHLESVLHRGPGAPGAPEPAASDEGPLEGAERGEETERLERALAALSPEHRRAIEARGAGVEWAELARELGLNSIGAARNLHARAMLALVQSMERRGPTPRGPDA
jgi:RNA polymerase sigma-70 factor (ECF subfamily)